jgi:flagellar basal body P-ring formation protein FlgA
VIKSFSKFRIFVDKSERKNMKNRLHNALNAVRLVLLIALSGNPILAQELRIERAASINLKLKPRADCPSNVLLLSDLVEMQGSDAVVQEIADLPIAPAPRIGSPQTWSRASIEKFLTLRGINSSAIRWKGSQECEVVRIEGTRPTKDAKQPELNAFTSNTSVQTANYTPTPLAASTINSPIDRSKFTTPFTTTATINQAERIAAEAISNYLQTKTNSTARWNITVAIPTEHAAVFSQKAKILGVAGGQPPWEGAQQFLFLVKGLQGEQSISIDANVKLPEMVVAANRPLAKGYVLKQEDLDWIPLPFGSKFGAEDCFSNAESLIGQQLRKAMSTQQVIRLSDAGPPTIIHVGDIIDVEVVSGSVVVATKGRAIEAGGMDDLVQVEVESSRSKVLARIISEKTVEVISSGSRVSSSKSNNKR